MDILVWNFSWRQNDGLMQDGISVFAKFVQK